VSADSKSELAKVQYNRHDALNSSNKDPISAHYGNILGSPTFMQTNESNKLL